MVRSKKGGVIMLRHVEAALYSQRLNWRRCHTPERQVTSRNGLGRDPSISHLADISEHSKQKR